MRIFTFTLFLALSLSGGRAFGVSIDESLDKIEETMKASPEEAIAELRRFNKSDLSKAQLVRFDMLEGIYRIFQADYIVAVSSLESALSNSSSTPEKVQILGYLATVSFIQKRYSESMAHISDMLSLINTIEDKDIQRSAYIRLASLYFQMGLFDQVGMYASKALNLAPEDAVKDICYANLYVAASLMRREELAKALTAFEQTQSYCTQHSLPLIATMATKGAGEVYLLESKIALAAARLEQALAEYGKFGFAIEIPSTQSLLAKAFLASGDSAKAGALASQVVANSAADDRALQDAWLVLAEVAAERGDYKQAFDARQKEVEYATRIVDETTAREMAYQAAKFNFEEQRREISLLNSERDGYLVQKETISREHSGALMATTVLLGICTFLSLILALGLSQRNRFMRLAQRDGLTGTYNRATGQEKSENALVSCMAVGEPASLILLDLDFFKRINDDFGHATGDWALKKVVDVLRSELNRNVSGEHILSRFGGEEFMIMLPGISGVEASEIAQQCRRAIHEVDTHYSGHKFSLSASFGVTELTTDDLSLDPMIVRADRSLYMAKHCGRNTVVLDGKEFSDVLMGEPKQGPAPKEAPQAPENIAGNPLAPSVADEVAAAMPLLGGAVSVAAKAQKERAGS
ncbi:diguanylate cyclase [Shewanella sp. JM162201]|uniref:diguanylate cyclase n=1 Tax=Shewanella jiangmenensis TaxID=2837387 RepID=A0ABS5V359_9GAMM|nr:GGDEF domain-containing protein [Shewanella jiangmenensis]MBT1444884.1 diguanylate cyclase [Shewanella jiangmenensis]